MKRNAKRIIGWSIAAIFGLILAANIEVLVRYCCARGLPAKLETNDVRIGGKVQPGFLFIGKEWHMIVHARKAVKLRVNGTYVLNVPAGRTEIRYDDDGTNTNEYTDSGTAFHEVPHKVEVIAGEPTDKKDIAAQE